MSLNSSLNQNAQQTGRYRFSPTLETRLTTNGRMVATIEECRMDNLEQTKRLRGLYARITGELPRNEYR